MKLEFRLLVIFIIPLLTLSVKANDKCHKSTEGTNFWFGFMEGRAIHDNSHYLEITVTAREATSFTIEMGSQNKLVGTYSVNSNSSVRVRSSDLVEATGSETVQNFGIHLSSEKPVNVYALNYNNTYSSDVAIIYPIESLGTEYFAMCYTPTIGNPANDYSSGGRNSEFLVVAILDSTVVKITPSVETDKRQPKGVPFQVVLNKGQVYQVQSKNKDDSSTLNQGDLTGSKIVSDKPVAFYSGSLSTTVPANTCCWDHLYEQIPPVRSWGKEFYTIPLKSRLVDRYRIIASEDNTTIYVKNSVVTLNAGGINEFTLNKDEPSRILADKPILVAQFSQSGEADNSGIGDPFMIILSPATQSKNDVTFVAYATSQIKYYFVNIVTLTTEVSNLNLTGASGNISIQNQFSPFPGGEYSFAQVTLESGTYRLWNPDPDKGFLAYVYGFGNVESYGYGVGFNLDLVLDLGKSINFKGDTLLLCYGDSRTLDAGPYFDTYLWNDSTTGQSLTVTEEGKYWALTTTNEGCRLFDSIYIKMDHPEIKLESNSGEGCSPFSISLVADSGFEKYIWKNESEDTLSNRPEIILNQTGKYSILVYNEHQCLASDTFNLKVFETPVAKIRGDTLVCGDLEIELEAVLSGADPQLWNKPGSLTWSTTSAKGHFSNADSTQTKFSVKDYGIYTVYFSVITSEGCEATDSINIRFQKTPVSAFDFGEDKKCEGYSKKLLFQGTASDNAEFFWDLDGCMFVDTIGFRQYNITVGAFLERQPMISLSINDHGCMSDTTIKPLGANPVYAMEALPTRGCDSLTTTFSCRLLKADNVEYTWTFGDEISHDSTVVRKYSHPGFYDVSLMIVNPVTQCKNGFTLDSMIQVFATPTAKILVDESVCYPDSFQAIYINNIDSSICNWNFTGAHQSGNGNDTIMVVIDSPTAKISLSVSEFGCPSDTIMNTVKRKPHFEIQSDTTEGCQPYRLKVWGISPDKNLEYNWLIDSATTVQADTAFYYFGQAGKFAIKLFAVSEETQCVDTLLEKDWIRINPKPQARYEVDFPVATIEHPTLTFTNLSSTGITHTWDFGDGTGSDLFNPRHSYNHLGDYETSLRITNEFGCSDTSFQTIKIVPFSNYTPNAFRPDSPIELNRFFMPVGTGADPARFNIRIFNRWGILIFESTNPENKWDGKTRNGTDAPMGNYIWNARFFDIQGFEHTQNGQVLLIR